MSDMMTQEEAMNMSNEQAVQILIPMRNMMYDQNGCPISDAVFALNKAIEALSAPSIDIVFCENCRDCVEKGVGVDCPSGYGYLYCRRKKSVVDESDYCSWGIEK